MVKKNLFCSCQAGRLHKPASAAGETAAELTSVPDFSFFLSAAEWKGVAAACYAAGLPSQLHLF